MTDIEGTVPVFSCIVYVSSPADGGIFARVANLPSIEATAASEREALAKIVAAFKQRVSELTQQKVPIPWIDPPLAPREDEQERLVPVHL